MISLCSPGRETYLEGFAFVTTALFLHSQCSVTPTLFLINCCWLETLPQLPGSTIQVRGTLGRSAAGTIPLLVSTYPNTSKMVQKRKHFTFLLYLFRNMLGFAPEGRCCQTDPRCAWSHGQLGSNGGNYPFVCNEIHPPRF